jgi:hypothetical protein
LSTGNRWPGRCVNTPGPGQDLYGGPDVPKITRVAPGWGANEEIALRVASYRPRTIDESLWAAIQPFVLSCASELPLAGQASATRTLRVLVKVALWARGEGIALDRELVFDPDTVERFVAVSPGSDTSRATYRAVLRHIGPLLTRKAPWEPRTAPVSRRQVAVPYTPAGLALLSKDARQQPTEGRRRAARALVALGAGAGLDGRWCTQVRAEDVFVDEVVLIRVGDPAPRLVPVLARWEAAVLDLATTAGGEYLVGGYSTSRNRASALTASLFVPPGHPKLSCARLRSTWLLSHLIAGTRLPELASAAGLRGITVLSDLLANVPPMDACDSVQMLRGDNL